MNSLSLSGLGLLPRQAILMLLTSLQQALVLSVTQSRSIRAILGDMSDSYYQGLFFFFAEELSNFGNRFPTRFPDLG
jgi:hypothetical protein